MYNTDCQPAPQVGDPPIFLAYRRFASLPFQVNCSNSGAVVKSRCRRNWVVRENLIPCTYVRNGATNICFLPQTTIKKQPDASLLKKNVVLLASKEPNHLRKGYSCNFLPTSSMRKSTSSHSNVSYETDPCLHHKSTNMYGQSFPIRGYHSHHTLNFEDLPRYAQPIPFIDTQRVMQTDFLNFQTRSRGSKAILEPANIFYDRSQRKTFRMSNSCRSSTCSGLNSLQLTPSPKVQVNVIDGTYRYAFNKQCTSAQPEIVEIKTNGMPQTFLVPHFKSVLPLQMLSRNVNHMQPLSPAKELKVTKYFYSPRDLSSSEELEANLESNEEKFQNDVNVDLAIDMLCGDNFDCDSEILKLSLKQNSSQINRPIAISELEENQTESVEASHRGDIALSLDADEVSGKFDSQLRSIDSDMSYEDAEPFHGSDADASLNSYKGTMLNIPVDDLPPSLRSDFVDIHSLNAFLQFKKAEAELKAGGNAILVEAQDSIDVINESCGVSMSNQESYTTVSDISSANSQEVTVDVTVENRTNDLRDQDANASICKPLETLNDMKSNKNQSINVPKVVTFQMENSIIRLPDAYDQDSSLCTNDDQPRQSSNSEASSVIKQRQPKFSEAQKNVNTFHGRAKLDVEARSPKQARPENTLHQTGKSKATEPVKYAEKEAFPRTTDAQKINALEAASEFNEVASSKQQTKDNKFKNDGMDSDKYNRSAPVAAAPASKEAETLENLTKAKSETKKTYSDNLKTATAAKFLTKQKHPSKRFATETKLSKNDNSESATKRQTPAKQSTNSHYSTSDTASDTKRGVKHTLPDQRVTILAKRQNMDKITHVELPQNYKSSSHVSNNETKETVTSKHLNKGAKTASILSKDTRGSVRREQHADYNAELPSKQSLNSSISTEITAHENKRVFQREKLSNSARSLRRGDELIKGHNALKGSPSLNRVGSPKTSYSRALSPATFPHQTSLNSELRCDDDDLCMSEEPKRLNIKTVDLSQNTSNEKAALSQNTMSEETPLNKNVVIEEVTLNEDAFIEETVLIQRAVSDETRIIQDAFREENDMFKLVTCDESLEKHASYLNFPLSADEEKNAALADFGSIEVVEVTPEKESNVVFETCVRDSREEKPILNPSNSTASCNARQGDNYGDANLVKDRQSTDKHQVEQDISIGLLSDPIKNDLRDYDCDAENLLKNIEGIGIQSENVEKSAPQPNSLYDSQNYVFEASRLCETVTDVKPALLVEKFSDSHLVKREIENSNVPNCAKVTSELTEHCEDVNSTEDASADLKTLDGDTKIENADIQEHSTFTPNLPVSYQDITNADTDVIQSLNPSEVAILPDKPETIGAQKAVFAVPSTQEHQVNQNIESALTITHTENNYLLSVQKPVTDDLNDMGSAATESNDAQTKICDSVDKKDHDCTETEKNEYGIDLQSRGEQADDELQIDIAIVSDFNLENTDCVQHTLLNQETITTPSIQGITNTTGPTSNEENINKTVYDLPKGNLHDAATIGCASNIKSADIPSLDESIKKDFEIGETISLTGNYAKDFMDKNTYDESLHVRKAGSELESVSILSNDALALSMLHDDIEKYFEINEGDNILADQSLNVHDDHLDYSDKNVNLDGISQQYETSSVDYSDGEQSQLNSCILEEESLSHATEDNLEYQELNYDESNFKGDNIASVKKEMDFTFNLYTHDVENESYACNSGEQKFPQKNNELIFDTLNTPKSESTNSSALFEKKDVISIEELSHDRELITEDATRSEFLSNAEHYSNILQTDDQGGENEKREENFDSLEPNLNPKFEQWDAQFGITSNSDDECDNGRKGLKSDSSIEDDLLQDSESEAGLIEAPGSFRQTYDDETSKDVQVVNISYLNDNHSNDDTLKDNVKENSKTSTVSGPKKKASQLTSTFQSRLVKQSHLTRPSSVKSKDSQVPLAGNAKKITPALYKPASAKKVNPVSKNITAHAKSRIGRISTSPSSQEKISSSKYGSSAKLPSAFKSNAKSALIRAGTSSSIETSPKKGLLQSKLNKSLTSSSIDASSQKLSKQPIETPTSQLRPKIQSLRQGLSEMTRKAKVSVKSTNSASVPKLNKAVTSNLNQRLSYASATSKSSALQSSLLKKTEDQNNTDSSNSHNSERSKNVNSILNSSLSKNSTTSKILASKVKTPSSIQKSTGITGSPLRNGNSRLSGFKSTKL